MSDPLKKFMNIWEIEPHFKCPVVGAMLSVDKHKNILKKCGYEVKSMKSYEYHSHLMGRMGDENPVSVKVNNFIRHQARKYMVEIAALFEKRAENAVRHLWDTCSGNGEIGTVMYAIVAHEDAGVQLLQDVHGEVHMQAHANMTEVFHVRQNLKASHETLDREKMKLVRMNEKFRELVGLRKSDALALEEFRSKTRELKTQIHSLEARVNPEENLIQAYEEKILALGQALALEQESARKTEREARQMQIQLFSVKNENELIRKELQELITSFVPASSQQKIPVSLGLNMDLQPDFDLNSQLDCPSQNVCLGDDCPHYQLCAKRVFMIGGITKMKGYYRDIVEKAGGKFDYHDGYMKNAGTNLAAKVKRCDVVVCPVSCNSHNACLQVKKLCHRYNKEVKFLNSASLSAVTQALFVPELAQAN